MSRLYLRISVWQVQRRVHAADMPPMLLVKVEMSAYLKTTLKVQTMVSNGNEGAV